MIDEVFVARRVFREEEVKALYLRGLNGVPVVSWLAAQVADGTVMDDGSGTFGFSAQAVETISTPVTVTITNTTVQTLSGLAVTLAGLNPADFIVNTSGMSTTLAPGVSTSFTVAFIPQSGGGRSGSVQVTSSSAGTANAFDFTVTGTGQAVAPVITSISPLAAQPGSSVTITGTNFSITPANNIVWFGVVKGTVTAAASTQLTVTVPGGAAHDRVRVTAFGLTAWSAQPFVPTFSGEPGFTPSSFAEAMLLDCDGNSDGAMVGDVDGDGLPDIVYISYGGGRIQIFRNLGAGTLTSSAAFPGGMFASPVNVSLPAVPTEAALGDLNGDGKPEIIVSHYTAASSVTVLVNASTSGNVSYPSSFQLTTGGSPRGVAIADLDADGRDEIIVADQGAGTLSIFANRTTGTLVADQFTRVAATTGGAPVGVAVGDLDSDGKPDIVCSLSGGNMVVLKNSATPLNITPASFTTGATLTTSGYSENVFLVDSNKDGHLDIILTDLVSDILVQFRNLGTGALSTRFSAVQPGLATASQARSLGVADFDGDGNVDAAVAAYDSKYSLFRNLYSAMTAPAWTMAARFDVTMTAGSNGGTVGDLDGDGRCDLIGINGPSGKMHLLRNTTPAFVPVPTITNLSATSGIPGSSLTITGTNFSTTPANNLVWFGAVKGTVTAATSTQLTVTIPAGAKHDFIRVSVAGKTGSSVQLFLPTFAGDPGLSSSSFAAPLTVSTEDSTTAVAAGDIDGDGAPDLVVSDYSGARMSVLRNLLSAGSAASSTAFSAGAFAAPVHFTVSLSAHGVVLGDLNNDGKLDAVVSGYTGSSVFVFINTSTPGNIAFSPYVQFNCGTMPLGMAVCDLNGDGRSEIVVAESNNGSGNTISVFRNVHPGGAVTVNSFERFSLITGSGSRAPYHVATGDLNGDAKPEIVVTNNVAGEVVIFGNNSTYQDLSASTFDAAVPYSTGTTPHPVTLADHDRDGDLDIVTGNYGSDNATVLRNTGSGSLSTRFTSNQSAVSTAGGPYLADAGDLDGDGYPDYAVACSGSTLTILRTQPISGGWSFAPKLNLPIGNYGNGGCAIVDLDRDGRPDVVAGSYQGGSVYVFRNIVPPFVPVPTITSLSTTSAKPGRSITITGTNFSAAPTNNIVWFGGVRGTVTAATSTELTVTVPNGAMVGQIGVQVGGRLTRSTQGFYTKFQGQGNLSTNSFSAVRALNGPSSPTKAAVADIDGDGRSDVVVANYSSTLNVFLNALTPGSLGVMDEFPANSLTGTDGSISFSVNANTLRVAAGDLDGDGKLDLVTSHNDIAKLSVLRNTSTNGTASFAAMFEIAVSGEAQGVTIADVNLDGRADIVATLVAGGAVTVLRNQHAGGTLSAASFNPPVDYAMSGAGECREVAMADVTGDGKPEILATRFSGSLSIRENLTSVYAPLDVTAFGPAVSITTGSGSDSILATDLDGDGNMDCVVSNYVGDTLSILRNSGAGTLSSRFVNFADKVSIDEGGAGISCGDLNGDGKVDIVLSAGASSAFQVFQNRNTPPLFIEDGLTISTGFYTYGANIVDMDADGRPDLVGGSYDSSKVLLVRNIHAYGTPQVVLEQPLNTALVDGGVIACTNTTVGQTAAAMTVTIRNTGTADLENLALSLSGAQTAEFSLGTLPGTILPPGASTTFTVTFSPAGLGTRTAALQIASNAAGAANPFDLTLTGSGINGTLTTNFTSGSQTGLTTNGLTATGSTASLSLGYAPTPGTILTLVNNTSANPISGTFTNLAQGQEIVLMYNSATYKFNADYFGGTGNDLVLALQGPGVLDYSLDARGKVVTAFSGNNDSIHAIVTQPDGKIVAVGATGNYPDEDFAIARYNANGTLDTSFNGTGKITLNLAQNDVLEAVALQSDGKIVVAGYSGSAATHDVVVARFHANGTLDTSFGGTGTVTTAVGSGDDLGYAVLVQPDGKIVLAGGAMMSNYDFALVRYTSSGALDASFGTGGKNTFSVTASHAIANALALQPDGKIVIGGYGSNGANYDFAAARVLADGTLDSSFGSGGKTSTAIGSSNDQPSSLCLQSNGSILLAGYSTTGSTDDVALVRYLANGSLDTSFGSSGKVVTAVGNGNDAATEIGLTLDGKILAAGYATTDGNADFTLLRYNSNGTLDTSFGSNGKITTAIGSGNDKAFAMAGQADGNVILAGSASNGADDDFAMARYTVETSYSGTFTSAGDVPFTANGITATGRTLNLTLGYAPTVGTELMFFNNTSSNAITGTFANIANGATVPLIFNSTTYNFIANYTGGTGNDLTLLLPGTGGLDYTFNGSGKVTTAIGSGADRGFDLKAQIDGKLVAAGTSDNGPSTDFAVVRYNSDGALDHGFGTGGKVLVDFGTNRNDYYSQLAIQADGKIVIAGVSSNGTDNDFAVARLNTDGTLDTSFGTGGKITTSIGPSTDAGYSVMVQPDGKIIVGGYSYTPATDHDFALVRYNGDGTLDASFGSGGKVTVLTSTTDYGYSMALQSDGKILLTGEYLFGGNWDFLTMRFNANGTLDSTFDGDGKVATAIGGGDDSAHCVAVLGDGKIVVAGDFINTSSGNRELAMVCYNADGSLDMTFGSSGKVIAAIGIHAESYKVMAQPDGRLVVAGFGNTGGTNDFAIARFLANGTLDTSFRGTGKALLTVGAGDDRCMGMTIQPNGRIVLAGQSFNGSNYDFAVARLTNDTQYNATFSAATDVPLSFNGLNPAGQTLNLTLNFSPSVGTSLKVFNNTSLQPIAGGLSNLAHGQVVTLNYSGTDYSFVANYFGGDGNDLVLQWANTKLTAFGSNDIGQLGITGTAAQVNVPTQVVATAPIYQKTILSMSAGEAHSLAVCSDGTVAAWGSNANGQLGNGSTTSASTPVAVTINGVLNGKKVIAVAAGGQHSLALCSDGTLAAWGDGSFGQIGDGGVLDRNVPVLVSTAGALNGKRMIAISAGANHSAALCSDGTVVCWGGNTNGELGNGSNTQSNVPVAVTTSGVLLGRTAVAVACGQNHTLALLADGAVAAWGLNASGQLGNSNTAASNVPVLVSAAGLLNGKRVVEIAAGGSSSLARCSDGVLAAWGLNDSGQLGVNSATTSFTTPQSVLMSGVLSGKTVARLFAGAKHAGALCSDGTLATWGEGTGGELGNNGVLDSLQPVLVNTAILGGADVFVQTSSGASAGHSLALIGTAANAPRIVVEHEGSSLTHNSLTPVNFGSLVAGAYRTKSFVVRNAGTQTLSGISATTLGADAGMFVIQSQPQAVLAPGEAAEVLLRFNPQSIGGRTASLRIANSGIPSPFIVNLEGSGDPELNVNWQTGREVPAQAAGFDASGYEAVLSLGFAPQPGTRLMMLENTGLSFIEGIFTNTFYGVLVHGQLIDLNYGGKDYTFVVNYYGGDGNDLVLEWAGNRLVSWGLNSAGALGNGSSTPTFTTLPSAVSVTTPLSGKTILAAACGFNHSLALCSDGVVAAWGTNSAGQLGNNSTTSSSSPVAVNQAGVLSGRQVVAVAAGTNFSVALCSDGRVATWGTDAEGQLGNDAAFSNSSVPVLVDNSGVLAGRMVTFIAAGGSHVLALCSDGTLVAWGSSNGIAGGGQLGNGSGAPFKSGIPVAVSTAGVLNGKTVARIAAGVTHSLAWCTDGTFAAWGENPYGMLGNGTNTSSSVPVLTTTSGELAGKTPVLLGAGVHHSIMLGTDGLLSGWGRNVNAQLGVSTATTFFYSPINVPATNAFGTNVIEQLVPGRLHHLVCLSDGTIAAWGAGSTGQLGNGASPTSSVTPVYVSPVALTAGERFARAYSGSSAQHNVAIVAKPITLRGGAPNVTTNAATSVDKTIATLNAKVNPSSLATDARFEYGLTTSYGTQTALQTNIGSGTSDVTLTQALTGLQPNTTYHYRVIATNSGGSAQGNDLTFTTLPDPPVAVTTGANSITNTSATLTGTVNPNTRATTVFFEFGTDTLYGNSTAPQNISAGSSNVNVIAPVSGLTLGTTYHFRLVAQNAAGTAYGDDVVFTTTSVFAPSVGSVSTSGQTISSVNVDGVVNPNGLNTSAYFEYGLTTSYGSVTGNLAAGTGTNPTTVSTAIAGLQPATTYHYRLAAFNNLGTTRGLDATFTTLPLPPDVNTQAATPLSTTSARLNGTADAKNGSATVTFEHSTDGTNWTSVPATPSTVTGNSPVPVTADLANLAQFTVYQFRVKAMSSGGVSTGGIVTFQPQIISGLLQQFPVAPPAATASITVTLQNGGSLTGWRLTGEQLWRSSGSTATGLTSGNRLIEYRPVPGFVQPPREAEPVSAGQNVGIQQVYYETPSSGSGGITVTLKPDSITGPSDPDRAQWRFYGESDAQWRNSSVTVTQLVPGSYILECKPVPSRATPSLASFTVVDGVTINPTITYFVPESVTGAQPVPLTFQTVKTTAPYAWSGQIRSNVGQASGFAVKQRVVATAAHVVFDDVSLTAVQGLQWLFQRHAGSYEPVPVTPRGFYSFDGYAAQRAADNSPGASSPASQHLDVAALYFLQNIAGDGFGGFLASDLNNNEFLLSNSNKMLIGYPIDGIAQGSQGVMHATAPFNVVFSPGYNKPDAPYAGIRTFITTGIRSSGGNSGGPLCVEHAGNWYPAGVFLGGTNQTVVRAIDSAVIDLFTRAAANGQDESNNNTGGGITHSSITTTTSSSGALKVNLVPATGGWRIKPETSYRPSGQTRGSLSRATYTIQFTPLSGYQAPTEQNILVETGTTTEITFTYASNQTPQESWRQTFFGTTNNTGSAGDNADPDADGFTNAQEYAAGTNPTISGDFFKADNPTRTGSAFSVGAAGKSGRTYVLERSTNLSTWTIIATQGPLGADGAVTLTDLASTGDAFFYRIRVSGP